MFCLLYCRYNTDTSVYSVLVCTRPHSRRRKKGKAAVSCGAIGRIVLFFLFFSFFLNNFVPVFPHKTERKNASLSLRAKIGGCASCLSCLVCVSHHSVERAPPPQQTWRSVSRYKEHDSPDALHWSLFAVHWMLETAGGCHGAVRWWILSKEEHCPCSFGLVVAERP